MTTMDNKGIVNYALQNVYPASHKIFVQLVKKTYSENWTYILENVNVSQDIKKFKEY